MGFAAILSAFTLGLVIFRINPYEATPAARLLFYSALFFTVSGAASLIGFVVRLRFVRDRMLSQLVAVSFRQSVIIAGLVVGIMLLLAERMFYWWNGIILAAAATAVEFFFIALEQKRIQ
jgi:hypothetical protein